MALQTLALLPKYHLKFFSIILGHLYCLVYQETLWLKERINMNNVINSNMHYLMRVCCTISKGIEKRRQRILDYGGYYTREKRAINNRMLFLIVN